jgi:poly(hydroxyalkanoate) granule-associated protein
MTKSMEELLVENEEQNRVAVISRKLFLAGLGAVVLAQDEFSKMASRFVEQGEETEKQSRKAVNDLMKTRRKEASQMARQVRKEANKRLETTLHAVNVPTRSDIERLNRKLTQLNKKLEALDKTAA